MNNSEFKSAKLRLEVSGMGNKSKTILTFNNLVEAPNSAGIAAFQTMIETLTTGTVEAKQCVVTSQMD